MVYHFAKASEFVDDEKLADLPLNNNTIARLTYKSNTTCPHIDTAQRMWLHYVRVVRKYTQMRQFTAIKLGLSNTFWSKLYIFLQNIKMQFASKSGFPKSGGMNLIFKQEAF